MINTLYLEQTMNVQLTFDTLENCKAFADRFKLNHNGTAELTIPWHFLHHAKNDSNVQNLSQLDTSSLHDFIVKGDRNSFQHLATIKQDMGNGFYLVESNLGVDLSHVVESIEITSQSVTYMANTSSIYTVNPDDTILDPTSADAQWPRIRIASRYRPLLPSFSLHNVTYSSKPEVYVMDSGINFTHQEFIKPGLETEDFYALSQFNGNFSDEIGHGTAVASLLVGNNLGVASNCKLINIKIGSPSYHATLFDLGLAIDAIMARISSEPLKTRIVNMSWGIPRSPWLDAKVQSLIDAGVTVVCAAGNDGISVEDISPAGLDTVITVGSIDKYDIPSGFNNISPSDSGLTTNLGLSLDIFAPGEDVIVADAASSTGYKIMSGTSLSTPLVTGILSEIAAINYLPVYYSELKSILLDTATEHALLFEDDRFTENQNRLAYIVTADPNAQYKQDNMLSYMGVVKSKGQPDAEIIVASCLSTISDEDFKKVFPSQTFSYEITFLDPIIGQQYSPFINLDAVTGEITIQPPDVLLPEETKLKMVEFRIQAKNNSILIESQTIFVFHANPLYEGTLDSDVLLALTETNSISFYTFWGRLTFQIK